MKRGTRLILILIVLALAPVIVKLQSAIDPGRKQFQPGRGVASMVTEVNNNPVVMPSQFIAGTLIGFREVVAGLLWIRTNDFFHTGNYEAVIPMTRMITWLDPHQIDVYRTGAWHLAYNLVDSTERADYRFLFPGIKFLEEGIQNNPRVSDLEFDLGFVIYEIKKQDYVKALYWITKACQESDATNPMKRQIAHALEKQGKIDEAAAEWRKLLAEGEAAVKKDPSDFRALEHRNVSKRNLDMMLVRKSMRKDLSKHPVEINFDAKFKRLGPRQFEIIGRAHLPFGTRIDMMLQDADFKEPDMKTFSWAVDPNQTVLADTGMHGLFVDNEKFVRKFNLTKDSKQYPFKAERYKLILFFNPRTAVDFTQDYTGWNGEGMTDKKYLDTSTPGLRTIKKIIYLKREDII